ncbi:MAG: 30S ribosome-binding factor RbfA [Clostridia bacterium]|nr:30S ribosome-binding factor RbfA [Clostridia bacterium]
MASFDRYDRIGEEVRRAIDRIIRDRVNDPRVSGTWSIARCEVTRDLRYCKVRVSVLEGEKRENMLKALKSASGFIRRELGREVDLRYTPEIIFELDENIAYADRINRILKEQHVDGGDSGTDKLD